MGKNVTIFQLCLYVLRNIWIRRPKGRGLWGTGDPLFQCSLTTAEKTREPMGTILQFLVFSKGKQDSVAPNTSLTPILLLYSLPQAKEIQCWMFLLLLTFLSLINLTRRHPMPIFGPMNLNLNTDISCKATKFKNWILLCLVFIVFFFFFEKIIFTHSFICDALGMINFLLKIRKKHDQ